MLRVWIVGLGFTWGFRGFGAYAVSGLQNLKLRCLKFRVYGPGLRM